jgi:hypothetical protein
MNFTSELLLHGCLRSGLSGVQRRVVGVHSIIR